MSKDSNRFSGERGLERSRSKYCQKRSCEPVEFFDTTRLRKGSQPETSTVTIVSNRLKRYITHFVTTTTHVTLPREY